MQLFWVFFTTLQTSRDSQKVESFVFFFFFLLTLQELDPACLIKSLPGNLWR